MRRSLFASLALIAVAAAPPDRLRDRNLSKAITAIIADVRPDDARATPKRVAAGIRLVDANGDAIPDYLFSLEAISYPGWCGTGGCRTQLWLGRSGAAPVKIFDAQVREAGFRTVRGRRIFDIDLHGSACHSFGAAACPASFVWDPSAGRMVEHLAGNGSSVIRLLRPIDSVDPAPPTTVRARLQQMMKQCRRAGGSMDWKTAKEAALTVPDVDGDRVRDWLIAYPNCAITGEGTEPEFPMLLFASAGRPAAPNVAAEASQIEIRLGGRAASVFAIRDPACLRDEIGGPRCARIKLRWDPAKRRFRAAGEP